jgi:hypothetical protein
MALLLIYTFLHDAKSVTCVRIWTKAAGCGEHGDEPSGFIKCSAFLDQLSSKQLLNKYCSTESVNIILDPIQYN